MKRTAKHRADAAIYTLERMPTSPDQVAQWFEQMEEEQFDSVCVSAMVYAIEDAQMETGFISARSAAVMANAMRERYRKTISEVMASKAIRARGELSYCATVNEVQARIIRRLPHYGAGHNRRWPEFGAPAYAKVFGCGEDAVRDIWRGHSWKHLDRKVAA